MYASKDKKGVMTLDVGSGPGGGYTKITTWLKKKKSQRYGSILFKC